MKLTDWIFERERGGGAGRQRDLPGSATQGEREKLGHLIEYKGGESEWMGGQGHSGRSQLDWADKEQKEKRSLKP
jgi:hypothetical protein